MLDDNNQEAQKLRSDPNQEAMAAASGADNTQKTDLLHISHLSKITSHPSHNSQCLHISKISKDANSFGAVAEHEERDHSKAGGQDSPLFPGLGG